MRLWYRIITIVLTLVLTLPMLASCGNPTVIPETEKPPIPAEFTVTNLVISPDDVEKGQPVTISATVTNSGGSPDSYTAILKINGSQVETKSITLNAGDNQVVSFTVVKESAGTYTIELGGLVGTFTVTPAPARFVLGELTITPTNAKTGELITISIPISNTGGTEGTYPLVLKLNGAVDATKNVTLNAGETKTVTFTVTKDIAGAYIVDINGKLSQVNVTAPGQVKPPPGIDWPAGATALCRDGTFSYSQNRRGTCSWHGGVAQWR